MFTFLHSLVPKTVRKTFYSEASTKQCPPPKVSTHKEGGYKIYKYMTLFVGLPAIAAVAAFTFIQKKSRGCPERPDFVPYETMRRRTKRFPWGDGNKSLFHNPEINAIPDGYEEDLECECGSKEDESSNCRE
ncbi:cytochrome c oxidase subunit 6A1, mitochondrial-like [Anoplophora glabripennis]|uniref:cytochrome c oxidase subunit 6A1, mitochondrial-like n=1 Tax=Anoplophora glabripennis TaxID=217634 RepID=UPI00087551BB|nr:cytochrome c oxidase subunit 6A1, mitochondrial-like [Anoplophora glabripennis]